MYLRAKFRGQINFQILVLGFARDRVAVSL
jgi:hypothetical protein